MQVLELLLLVRLCAVVVLVLFLVAETGVMSPRLLDGQVLVRDTTDINSDGISKLMPAELSFQYRQIQPLDESIRC